MFPDSRLRGQANTLILPDLTSANIAYGMLKVLADGISVGPILLGLAAPAYVLHGSATTRGVLNMTAVAAVEAQSRAEESDRAGRRRLRPARREAPVARARACTPEIAAVRPSGAGATASTASRPGSSAPCAKALAASDGERVRALIAPLHEADTADLIERFRPGERRRLVAVAHDVLSGDVLPHLEDEIREALIGEIGAAAGRRGDRGHGERRRRRGARRPGRPAAPGDPRCHPERGAGRRRRGPDLPGGQRRPPDANASWWRCRRSGPWARPSTTCARAAATCRTISTRFTSSTRSTGRSGGSRCTGCCARPPPGAVAERSLATDVQGDPRRDRPGGGGPRLRPVRPRVGAGDRLRAGVLIGVITVDDVVDVIQEEAEEDTSCASAA